MAEPLERLPPEARARVRVRVVEQTQPAGAHREPRHRVAAHQCPWVYPAGERRAGVAEQSPGPRPQAAAWEQRRREPMRLDAQTAHRDGPPREPRAAARRSPGLPEGAEERRCLRPAGGAARCAGVRAGRAAKDETMSPTSPAKVPGLLPRTERTQQPPAPTRPGPRAAQRQQPKGPGEPRPRGDQVSQAAPRLRPDAGLAELPRGAAAGSQPRPVERPERGGRQRAPKCGPPSRPAAAPSGHAWRRRAWQPWRDRCGAAAAPRQHASCPTDCLLRRGDSRVPCPPRRLRSKTSEFSFPSHRQRLTRQELTCS